MGDDLPLLAVTVGDPAGIGPEIVRAAFRDGRVRAAARLVGIGAAEHAPPYASASDLGAGISWIDPGAPSGVPLGRASAEGGRAALAALRRGHELAAAGRVDALVTAPVSKEALHLAGQRVEGQTELLARWDGARDHEMLAVAGELRVMLFTRHLPLRRALEALEAGAVARHLGLLDRALRDLGIPRPRVALAGLNPHAGENGLLGDEEEQVLRPAAALARAQGIDVAGPLSPDTVFLQASRGVHDGVLALYHDQAFIPVKLLAPGRAVTVIAGLSYLRVSPAHGTAFDIAGRGEASPENLVEALLFAARRATAAGRRRSG